MAYDELESEIKESKEFMKDYLQAVHGTFINETDFEASELDVNAKGEANFKAFVNEYISYKYAPAIEDYDEARYFTEHYDKNLMSKLHRHPKQQIFSIKFKS